MRYCSWLAVILLASCAPYPEGVPGLSTGENSPVIGYRYYDNFHPNYVNQPSQQAIANARRGTYLWPPFTNEDP